ncbi:Golgi-specific brefeldin A-resistance guanine nucleotide exchange factor 1 [Venturia canescens]|uniref:Golgi-specific brefeldin A-resistance guanine nucleotide exchange factor 1 n=1 Tax=Venturia canescens TaxID=32260 RepID=UPI001C9C71E8|nr:Golgi-specific brefeldin A-resistance guanine nucleotide exchange factor 1 [Venturia canescens]
MIRTTCPLGGLFVVEGEVGLLMTAMRRGVRWSSHSHQDEDQDVLMKGLSTLKEALNDARNLSALEPGVFLAPFLEIVRSEETTGPVTSLALSAVNKMISYGLIDHEHPAIGACVEAIADAVTHARFVGTDASGDGVVLMRILQVLRALVLSPAGDHLSDESICEIMLSCFRICFETRLSELLRRTAEHCLRDMVHHLFARLSQFADDTRVIPNMKKMRTNGMENSRGKLRKGKNVGKQKSLGGGVNKQTVDQNDEESETRLLSPVDRARADHLATTPVIPVGNIVDMQGSLDHGAPDKPNEEESSKVSSSNDSEKKQTSENNDDKKIEENPSQGAAKTEETSVGESSTVKEKLADSQETNKLEDSKASDPVEKCNKNIDKEIQSSNTTDDSKEPVDKKKDVISEKETGATSDNEKVSENVQSPVGSVEDLSLDDNTSIGSGNNNVKTPKIPMDSESQLEEYVNTQGVRFTPLQQLSPYGALCVRELFRFLVSLCSPLDKQNTEIMMHLGLSLLQVALEIAADSLANFPSLLSLAKDELCRNLILQLGTDRLSILAADLQVSFLLFESQREHLKFQLEHYILKLMEIVDSDSNRITYEQRELALEAIVRIWRVPGLPAELYLNYDCGLYSTNLYEDLMKLLSKNASALMGSMYSIQFISLEAIISLVVGIEARCKGYRDLCKPSRHQNTEPLPTRSELLSTKASKRWLALGTEKFNENPREGIAKLTEHGLLSTVPGGPSDPEKIAKLLRENPMLDKKAIGEYISRKENKTILNCFVQNFDFHNTRIDQALRQYLESFRLPGEAPVISLLLEKFADHWHDSNGRPFASADAAFTLAYAVIMLNVDQHNYNAKRQSIPMTAEEFKRNLKKVDGGADFDQDMLDEIYTSIKGEEIVMPAEQTGLVKENYLWKVLLRRGASRESIYLKVGNSGEFVDKELAERAWAPIISALCRAYDKAPDRSLQRRVAQTFLSCASISSYYAMSSDLDTLVVSLCKFTGLATGGEPEQIVLHLGGSGRCQLAARTLFKITHLYGNGLRSSWKNIIDSLQTLHKARLLPKAMTEGEDFLETGGRVSLIREPTTPKAPPVEQGILSSLYSYIALETTRPPHPAEAMTRKRATDCIANCYLKQIIEESKFLEVDSLRSLIGALVSVNPHDEDISVFILELLLDVTIQNRDRVMCVWPIVQAHLDGLLTTAARENHPYLLERVAVGMLRLAIRLLRGEEFAWTVLPPLMPITLLPSATTPPLSRQIAYGLFELLKTGAANIHSSEDWKVVFALLECAGAGALQPKQQQNATGANNNVSNNSAEETSAPSARTSVLDQRPVSPIPEWVLVSPTGTEAPLPVAADTIILDRDLQPHDPVALAKCCESLVFLVRDVAHVTPFNFELCIRCVRTFGEAVLQNNSTTKRGRVNSSVGDTATNPAYQQAPLQLLDLMHTLHTRTAQIFNWWAEENGQKSDEIASLWPQAWKPLLQGIARLCSDSRRPVRASAITFLQSTLLAHDLAQLTAIEWSQCLEQVLFPLLAQLLDPVAPNDPSGIEETRVRAAMLLSKVFLHHLTPLLTLPGFLPLWLTVLDLLRAYMHADNSELLFEAIPESLKNMLLVMSSTNVLTPTSSLWEPTWRTINAFLPNLRSELFPEPSNVENSPINQASSDSRPKSPQGPVISLVEQEQPAFQNSIAPQPEIPRQRLNDCGGSSNYIPINITSCAPEIGTSTGLPAIPVLLSNVGTQEETSRSQETANSQIMDIPKPEAPQDVTEPRVISLLGQEQPSFTGQIALQPEMFQESSRVLGNSVNFSSPTDHGGNLSYPNASSLPSDVLESKEHQQVVNLLNQPPPSVSSPVAVQPTAQSFDFYRIAEHSPDSSILMKTPDRQAWDTPVVETLPDNQKFRDLEISSEYVNDPVASEHLTKSTFEIQTEDSKVSTVTAPSASSVTTTMFNSAAYFSEDPAADRLFVVTNP